MSKIASMSNNAVHSVYRGRKRKCIEEDELDSESDYIDRTLQTPKKYEMNNFTLMNNFTFVLVNQAYYYKMLLSNIIDSAK